MTITNTEPTVAALWDALDSRVARGGRFAGLFAAQENGAVILTAHIAVSPRTRKRPPG